MRKNVLAFLLTGFTLSVSAQSSVDILHYKFQLELSDTSDIIRGTATIKIRALKNTSSVELDFTKYSQGKGMNVSGIHAGERDDNRLSFSNNNDKLIIQLEKVLNEGSEKLITLVYWGIPKDALIISKNKYGNRTFFADNWPNRGHNWLPCVDDPADKASVEFIVTAPQHYQVVANGIQVEETNLRGKKLTHWKEDIPISTKVMAIGVADFAVNLSAVVDGCIPVYSWVYPENRDKGFYDYAQAAEILPYFIKNVGPYAYKKLANVQSKINFGGLENANTIFYSENSIDGTRKSESLLTHEIAHQWFGNMATEKTFAHLWLSEGFATYMTILYLENKYGADTAKKMLLEDRQRVIDFAKHSDRPVVDNTPDYMSLLNINSYQKGSWVLHMLRRQLGDSIFWKSIRTYYSSYAGKTADTDDLRKVIEKTSGKDFSNFFTQWLFTPGIPDLKISWKYRKDKKIDITVEQLQEHLYNFPLELGVASGHSKSRIEKLNITKKKEIFTLTATQQPVTITTDPFVSLLFSGKLSEIK